VVLFLGRKTPDKGFDLLLHAAPHLWRRFPDARIVLAGAEGRDRPIPAAANDPRVVQLGHIDDAEREDAYAACDVFCLPSFAEAFGLVVLEAWGYGKPVVASDIPTLSERLARGGGLTAPLEPEAIAEALARVLGDTELRDRLGAEGRAQAATATWSATARSMTSIYEAAIAGRIS
jgi:glycosyltransferase involved in cell wall biosynthesis